MLAIAVVKLKCLIVAYMISITAKVKMKIRLPKLVARITTVPLRKFRCPSSVMGDFAFRIRIFTVMIEATIAAICSIMQGKVQTI